MIIQKKLFIKKERSLALYSHTTFKYKGRCFKVYSDIFINQNIKCVTKLIKHEKVNYTAEVDKNKS